MAFNNSSIANSKLAGQGLNSWQWASSRMGVIRRILYEFGTTNPLNQTKLGVCLHITKETSVLVMAALRLGAKVAICSANPLSVQDDIAAFLFSKGVSVFARRDETVKQYKDGIKEVLNTRPEVLVDDGSAMHVIAHSTGSEGIVGGTEETTSGIRRLKSLEKKGKLKYPVIGVNDALSKQLFDNKYGTGQSTMDGIIRITNLLIAGKNIVVCGYGSVGKGVAARARGLGAIVTVTETNSHRALEAHMDGFIVKRLIDAVSEGDIFITCTGQIHVIRKEHISRMKSDSILANAGHFDTEIDTKYLKSNCDDRYLVRRYIECFRIRGKKVYLLSSGRVVNLVGSEGNAPEVMAMSFANQLLSLIYICRNHRNMKRAVHDVPIEIDEYVALTSLKSLDIKIDKLTAVQMRYSDSY